MKHKLRSKNPFIRACYFRGLVLNAFIFLENELAACLAEFFSGNNDYYWTFMGVIADRMTFEAKRSSLRFLLEDLEKKDGFVKTKSNSYACKELLNELRLLNDQRNYFAHYQSFNIEAKKEFAIVLHDWRDTYTEHAYSDDDIQKLVDRIRIATHNVAEIYRAKQSRDEDDTPDPDGLD